MANLFISYDLDKEGQNYPRIEAAILVCGEAIKVNLSVYYVKTVQSASDIYNFLRTQIDMNDRLLVIDTSNNNAYAFNLLGQSEAFLRAHWNA